MNKKILPKYSALGYAIVIFIGVCLFPIMFKPNIWFDESFTINLVREPLREIIRITALDVHPPLYYLVVKLFVSIFGDHLFVFHLPSVICFLGLLVISFLFFGKYFDIRYSLCVLLVLGSAPNMLMYALQIRMYSMAMLFVAASFYLVFTIMRKYESECPKFRLVYKYWLGVAFSNVAAAYTHYFAGVAAVCISFFLLALLLIRHKKKEIVVSWLIHCAVMFFLYLPWFPVLFKQMLAVNKDCWIGPITEGALHEFPQIIFSMTDNDLRILLIAAYVIGSFLCIVYYEKSVQYFWVMGSFAVVFLWVLFGVGYSVLKSPILIDRYFVILLPLLWFPPLYGLIRSKTNYIFAGLILLFSICFINNYEEQYENYATAEDGSLVAYMEENMQKGDVFFHFYVQSAFVCESYFPEREHYLWHTALNGEMPAMKELTGAKIVQDLEELPEPEGNIWCLNGDWIGSFESLGYQTETIDLGNEILYRLYK